MDDLADLFRQETGGPKHVPKQVPSNPFDDDHSHNQQLSASQTKKTLGQLQTEAFVSKFLSSQHLQSSSSSSHVDVPSSSSTWGVFSSDVPFDSAPRESRASLLSPDSSTSTNAINDKNKNSNAASSLDSSSTFPHSSTTTTSSTSRKGTFFLNTKPPSGKSRQEILSSAGAAPSSASVAASATPTTTSSRELFPSTSLQQQQQQQQHQHHLSPPSSESLSIFEGTSTIATTATSTTRAPSTAEGNAEHGKSFTSAISSTLRNFGSFGSSSSSSSSHLQQPSRDNNNYIATTATSGGIGPAQSNLSSSTSSSSTFTSAASSISSNTSSLHVLADRIEGKILMRATTGFFLKRWKERFATLQLSAAPSLSSTSSSSSFSSSNFTPSSSRDSSSSPPRLRAWIDKSSFLRGDEPITDITITATMALSAMKVVANSGASSSSSSSSSRIFYRHLSELPGDLSSNAEGGIGIGSTGAAAMRAAEAVTNDGLRVFKFGCTSQNDFEMWTKYLRQSIENVILANKRDVAVSQIMNSASRYNATDLLRSALASPVSSTPTPTPTTHGSAQPRSRARNSTSTGKRRGGQGTEEDEDEDDQGYLFEEEDAQDSAVVGGKDTVGVEQGNGQRKSMKPFVPSSVVLRVYLLDKSIVTVTVPRVALIQDACVMLSRSIGLVADADHSLFFRNVAVVPALSSSTAPPPRSTSHHAFSSSSSSATFSRPTTTKSVDNFTCVPDIMTVDAVEQMCIQEGYSLVFKRRIILPPSRPFPLSASAVKGISQTLGSGSAQTRDKNEIVTTSATTTISQSSSSSSSLLSSNCLDAAEEEADFSQIPLQGALRLSYIEGVYNIVTAGNYLVPLHTAFELAGLQLITLRGILNKSLAEEYAQENEAEAEAEDTKRTNAMPQRIASNYKKPMINGSSNTNTSDIDWYIKHISDVLSPQHIAAYMNTSSALAPHTRKFSGGGGTNTTTTSTTTIVNNSLGAALRAAHAKASLRLYLLLQSSSSQNTATLNNQAVSSSTPLFEFNFVDDISSPSVPSSASFSASASSSSSFSSAAPVNSSTFPLIAQKEYVKKIRCLPEYGSTFYYGELARHLASNAEGGGSGGIGGSRSADSTPHWCETITTSSSHPPFPPTPIPILVGVNHLGIFMRQLVVVNDYPRFNKNDIIHHSNDNDDDELSRAWILHPVHLIEVWGVKKARPCFTYRVREKSLINIEITSMQFKEIASCLHMIVFSLMSLKDGQVRPASRPNSVYARRRSNSNSSRSTDNASSSSSSTDGGSYIIDGKRSSMVEDVKRSSREARKKAENVLAEGWSEITDPATGNIVYWNIVTKQTVFSKPVSKT